MVVNIYASYDGSPVGFTQCEYDYSSGTDKTSLSISDDNDIKSLFENGTIESFRGKIPNKDKWVCGFKDLSKNINGIKIYLCICFKCKSISEFNKIKNLTENNDLCDIIIPSKTDNCVGALYVNNTTLKMLIRI